MEAARGLTLTRLAACQALNGKVMGAEAYALFEPWPNWTRDFLKSRYAFYQSTGKGDAVLARAQLAEFLAADSGSFSRGLATSTQ
jgi:hypothetical protein